MITRITSWALNTLVASCRLASNVSKSIGYSPSPLRIFKEILHVNLDVLAASKSNFVHFEIFHSEFWPEHRKSFLDAYFGLENQTLAIVTYLSTINTRSVGSGAALRIVPELYNIY